jgi:hypothetical protein
VADLNSLQLRDDVVDEIPADMDLPEQMGAPAPTLMPGVDLFRLPATLPQLWDVLDEKVKDGNGQETGATVQRLKLKFDRDNPLVVIGGPRDGQVLQATITTVPRKRGKKDSDAPSVADMTYLLRECLQDKTVIKSNKDWVNALNKHANAVVRLEHGLSGYCNPEKVRYIDVLDAEGNATGETVPDPSGLKGCGKRHYTQAFKNPDGTYATETGCECGAVVRGFAQIERFLKPVGVK